MRGAMRGARGARTPPIACSRRRPTTSVKQQKPVILREVGVLDDVSHLCSVELCHIYLGILILSIFLSSILG